MGRGTLVTEEKRSGCLALPLLLRGGFVLGAVRYLVLRIGKLALSIGQPIKTHHDNRNSAELAHPKYT